MKSTHHVIQEDLICSGSGYKPANLHSWGPGIRDIFALHYIIQGKGYLVTGNNTYTLKAGESFIIFPQTEVYYYPDSKDPWEYIWIDFKGNEALRLLSLIDFTPQEPVVPAAPNNLEPLFCEIPAAGFQAYEKERSNAKLRLLLSYYMEYYPKSNTTVKTDYVRSAKEYMENNYWKASLSVADITDFVNIERTYLFRLFKEATGMSILNYLITYRIWKACDLLRTTDLTVKSIACSVGYQDQLYFSKIFKKSTGYAPSEYRNI